MELSSAQGHASGCFVQEALHCTDASIPVKGLSGNVLLSVEGVEGVAEMDKVRALYGSLHDCVLAPSGACDTELDDSQRAACAVNIKAPFVYAATPVQLLFADAAPLVAGRPCVMERIVELDNLMFGIALMAEHGFLLPFTAPSKPMYVPPVDPTFLHSWKWHLADLRTHFGQSTVQVQTYVDQTTARYGQGAPELFWASTDFTGLGKRGVMRAAAISYCNTIRDLLGSIQSLSANVVMSDQLDVFRSACTMLTKSHKLVRQALGAAVALNRAAITKQWLRRNNAFITAAAVLKILLRTCAATVVDSEVLACASKLIDTVLGPMLAFDTQARKDVNELVCRYYSIVRDFVKRRNINRWHNCIPPETTSV